MLTEHSLMFKDDIWNKTCKHKGVQKTERNIFHLIRFYVKSIISDGYKGY